MRCFGKKVLCDQYDPLTPLGGKCPISESVISPMLLNGLSWISDMMRTLP